MLILDADLKFVSDITKTPLQKSSTAFCVLTL